MLSNLHAKTKRLVYSREQLNVFLQQRTEYPQYLFDEIEEEREREDSKVFELGNN